MVNNGVQEISKCNFEQFINKPAAVVDFFAEWCMPCLMLSPAIEEMAEKFKSRIEFARLDIDENSEIANKFKISSVPTVLFFKEGKLINRIIGNLPPNVLEERFNKMLIGSIEKKLL